jgi:hypothetical protein
MNQNTRTQVNHADIVGVFKDHLDLNINKWNTWEPKAQALRPGVHVLTVLEMGPVACNTPPYGQCGSEGEFLFKDFNTVVIKLSEKMFAEKIDRYAIRDGWKIEVTVNAAGDISAKVLSK